MNDTYDAMDRFEDMVQTIGDVVRNQMLKDLPDIKFFRAGSIGDWHCSDMMIFPDIDGMEANYFAVATGCLPKEPRLEITIPSTLDDSLAPKGHHVMSILAKYSPFDLADGTS